MAGWRFFSLHFVFTFSHRRPYDWREFVLLRSMPEHGNYEFDFIRTTTATATMTMSKRKFALALRWKQFENFIAEHPCAVALFVLFSTRAYAWHTHMPCAPNEKVGARGKISDSSITAYFKGTNCVRWKRICGLVHRSTCKHRGETAPRNCIACFKVSLRFSFGFCVCSGPDLNSRSTFQLKVNWPLLWTGTCDTGASKQLWGKWPDMRTSKWWFNSNRRHCGPWRYFESPCTGCVVHLEFWASRQVCCSVNCIALDRRVCLLWAHCHTASSTFRAKFNVTNDVLSTAYCTLGTDTTHRTTMKRIESVVERKVFHITLCNFMCAH